MPAGSVEKLSELATPGEILNPDTQGVQIFPSVALTDFTFVFKTFRLLNRVTPLTDRGAAGVPELTPPLTSLVQVLSEYPTKVSALP